MVGGDFFSLGIVQIGGPLGGGDHLEKALAEKIDQVCLVFLVRPVDGFQGWQGDQTDRVVSGFAKDLTEAGQLGGDDPAPRGQPFEKHQGQPFEKGGQHLDMGAFHQPGQSAMADIAVQGHPGTQSPGQVDAFAVFRPAAASRQVKMPVPVGDPHEGLQQPGDAFAPIHFSGIE
jgi:hypothetical protein